MTAKASTVSRDLNHERDFLQHAAASAGASNFVEHATTRLHEGGRKFGDRWTTLTLAEFLRELSEEAADLGAWAVLADQAIVQHSADAATPYVAAALRETARAGARAHRALDALTHTLNRLHEARTCDGPC